MWIFNAVWKKNVIPFLLIPLFYFPCYISNEFLIQVTQEDGVYENLGAIFFLLTALSFFLLTTKFKNVSANGKQRRRESVYFSLLALLFFFAFGEEISWGQRIFNYETPEFLQESNAQREFNLHNVGIFHGRTEDGEEKKGLQALLTMHRLFYITFFTYLLLIPLLHRSSARVRAFFKRLYLPIPPIIFGLLFCANWLFGNVLRATNDHLKGHGVVEIKETVFALFLFALSLYWIRLRRNEKRLS